MHLIPKFINRLNALKSLIECIRNLSEKKFLFIAIHCEDEREQIERIGNSTSFFNAHNRSRLHRDGERKKAIECERQSS